jgi:predicted Ser/Thr protein kinase
MPGPSLPATAAPAPAPAVPAAIATGTLDLRSDPPGATVLLGNRLLGVTPLRIELPAGVHQITLRKEGSAESSFPVQIRPGAPTLTTRELIATAPAASTPAAPTPEGSSLVVYSQPAGAAVYLDDELLGTTAPGSGRLVRSGVSAGPHRLRLVLEGHDDALHELNVDAAGPTTVRASLAPSTRRSRTIALVLAGLFVLGGVGYALWQRRGKPEPQRAKPSLQPTTVEPPTLAPPTIGSSPTPTPLPTAAPIENQETRAATRVSASGERFGEYRLLEQLGRGGMAMVFKAERNGELCALKRPLGGFIDDPEFRERFLREAEIGRTLHHPNIIRIFERGEVSGTPYFTMELIEGETLQARVRRDGALGPREATRVIAQVAEALDYAHLKGVVHRDLKPSNIMLLRDGVVKVMDYGIARARRFEGLTVTGAFLGTPDYVAPETAEGKGTDARSDLYSLGIVYYEILTARKPFVGNTPFDTLKKHCTEPPTPPSALAPGTPAQIEAIILRLLRKNPEERYPGAEELLIELRDYLNRAA